MKPELEKKQFKTFNNASRDHVSNFLDCIRTRKTPNATVEMGQYTNVVLCMALESLRSGGRVKWDTEERRMILSGWDAARGGMGKLENRLCRRPRLRLQKTEDKDEYENNQPTLVLYDLPGPAEGLQPLGCTEVSCGMCRPPGRHRDIPAPLQIGFHIFILGDGASGTDGPSKFLNLTWEI
jgi:hypothetical protein